MEAPAGRGDRVSMDVVLKRGEERLLARGEKILTIHNHYSRTHAGTQAQARLVATARERDSGPGLRRQKP